MVNIDEIIKEIPEDTADEALGAIESITINRGDNKADLRCYLSEKFSVSIKANENGINISSQWDSFNNVPLADVEQKTKELIYNTDAAIASGECILSKKKNYLIFPDIIPPAPAYMDIPIWDEKKKRWYDAEC